MHTLGSLVKRSQGAFPLQGHSHCSPLPHEQTPQGRFLEAVQVPFLLKLSTVLASISQQICLQHCSVFPSLLTFSLCIDQISTAKKSCPFCSMDLFNQVAISIKVDLGIFYSVTDNLIESFFTLFPVLQPWLLGAPSGLLSLVAQPPCFLAPYGFPGFCCPSFSLG